MTLLQNSRFFNTIQASQQLMIVYDADAKTQEDSCLEVLHLLKSAAYFEVAAFLPEMDLASLKRALSVLQDRGLIAKDKEVGNMVRGPRGKNCHRYHIIKK